MTWREEIAGWAAQRPAPTEHDEPDEPSRDGICWYCGEPFTDSLADFEPGAAHGRCAERSRKIDAGLRGKRDEPPADWMRVAW
jgi:hypothetical protein